MIAPTPRRARFRIVAATAVSTRLPLVARSSRDFHVDNPLGGCRKRTDAATPRRRRDHGAPRYRFCSWSTANGAIAMPTKEASAGPSFGDSYATVPIVAPTRAAVTAGDHRTVCSPQPAAADRRPRIRCVAPPLRTNLARPTTPISLCCFSLGCGVVPDDDVRPRDGRQRCASRTTRGVSTDAREVAAGGFLTDPGRGT